MNGQELKEQLKQSIRDVGFPELQCEFLLWIVESRDCEDPKRHRMAIQGIAMFDQLGATLRDERYMDETGEVTPGCSVHLPAQEDEGELDSLEEETS